MARVQWGTRKAKAFRGGRGHEDPVNLRTIGLRSEPLPSQYPFLQMAKVGEDIEVPCHSYGYATVGKAFWYKQTHGVAPKLLDTQSCNGSSCKFTSVTVNSTYKLKSRDVRRNDSGSYYCSEQYGYLLRNASTLLVGGKNSMCWGLRYVETHRHTLLLSSREETLKSDQIRRGTKTRMLVSNLGKLTSVKN
uniref:Ig-like domain-containing protein n=1 Tax=Callorhinchus milii TaxID=7868 RepID=A0A4W3H0L0_CALMI